MGGQSELDVDGFTDAEEIGRGGFGTVYRAFQPRFNRTVAVKVVRTQADERARSRFERECQTLGSMSGHPNIVHIFDAGFTRSGHPWLAMAFMPGGSLAEQIGRQNGIPWPEAVAVTIKLAGALETAHLAGILHRDVKPENVLISDYGEPQLADFGLARLRDDQYQSTTITASLAHAAPEILAGEPASVVSDVYALGSTLFTMLAGSPPFVRPTDESVLPILARVAAEPIPDLRRRGVPDEVCAVVEKATDKEPYARYASAGELARHLQRVQAGAGLPVTTLPLGGGGGARSDLTTPVTPASGSGPAWSGPPPQPPPSVAAPPPPPPAPSPAPPPPPAPSPAPTVPDAVPVPTAAGPAPLAAAAPPPGRPGRWKVPVLAAVAAAAVAVAVAVVVTSSSKETATSTTATTAAGSIPTTAAPAGLQVAQRFAGFLDQNTGARAQVVQGVGGVQACTMDPKQGSALVGTAIQTRSGIVSQLASLDTTGLPEGPQLRSVLQLARQASIDADRHYQAWMSFVAGAGCVGSAPRNSDLAAADATSAQAGAAKDTFVEVWNRVATRFSLRQISESDL